MERLRRSVRDDSGVSLAELIVVMVVSGIVLTLVAQFFVTVAFTTTKAGDSRESTAEASNIMNVVSTSIRAAVDIAVKPTNAAQVPDPTPAVVVGTSNELVVTTYTDAGPTFPVPLMIRYYVNADGQMIEQRWAATGCTVTQPAACPASSQPYPKYPTLTSAAQQSRVLGNLVVNSALCVPTDANCEPLFSYFDASMSPIAVNDAGKLDAGKLADVAFIRFDLQVQASSSAAVVKLDNTVGMPNTF